MKLSAISLFLSEIEETNGIEFRIVQDSNKIWPISLYIGNQISFYLSKPSLHLFIAKLNKEYTKFVSIEKGLN
jgi:hypothetical protein